MASMTAIAMMGSAIAVAGATAPSFAGQNIGWFWNSSDHDVEGDFVAKGDTFNAYEYHGTGYIDYTYYGHSGNRWFIPGDDTGKKKVNNLSMKEGKTVTMKVRQKHSAYPDDCAGPHYGVS